jgi:hypothetical protein
MVFFGELFRLSSTFFGGGAMEKIKTLLFKHFEKILVLTLSLLVVFVNFFHSSKACFSEFLLSAGFDFRICAGKKDVRSHCDILRGVDSLFRH